MSGALFKALVALLPVCALLAGSELLFSKRKSLCSFLQLFGAACLLVAVLTHVCEAIHLFPSMRWGHRSSPGHYLDFWSAALGLTLFPIGYLFCAITTRRKTEHWLLGEMADKLARAESAIPQIVAVPMKCKVRREVRSYHAEQAQAWVHMTLHLENRGASEAHNYEIAVYSCWLKVPTEWDKWAGQFFATWPASAPVEFHFSRAKIAEDQGNGRLGFLVGDELVFAIEVTGRVKAADGKLFENEQIWLSWDAGHTDRIVPPNEAIVQSLQSHLAKFKASIP